jgi:type IV pilus assembly protein PilV
MRSTIVKQNGVTLLEVLVSVLVLGIGLLGVAGLQTSSMRNTHSSYERTMSVILTDTLSELMRSNPTVARAGGYSIADCTGNAALRTDLWVQNVKAVTTSDTCPTVLWNAANARYTVTIAWSDARVGQGSQIVTQVVP